MKKQYKLGVIGCGEMAKTLLRGIVMSNFLKERKIVVSDDSFDCLEDVKYLGVNTVCNNKFVAQNSEFLLIATQRDKFNNVAEEIKNCEINNVISISVGLSKETIKSSIGFFVKTAIAVMNFPSTIGSGAISLEMNDYNDDANSSEFIYNLFDCFGKVTLINSTQIPIVSALSISASSIVYMLIDALVDSGIKNGLSRAQALNVITQTIIGSAEIVEQNNKTVPELVIRSSKNDSFAIDAIKILENGDYTAVIKRAINHCSEKFKELS